LAAPDSANTPSSRYRGRFAPSPTGPLHLGSIVAALASFLDARAVGGAWLVRMEDIDPPREMPGAADHILRTLERLHLYWDEAVVYQSKREAAYHAALATLQSQQLVYACRCSRLELAGAAIYPGTCRDLGLAHAKGTALRCRVPPQISGFNDRLQGDYSQQLANDVGDFVLLRKEGFFAYQLAVVVDDGWQGITDIVRGCDLLDSTPRQLWLQQRLGLLQPRYAHVPLIINAQGQKLGKQQHSPAIDGDNAAGVLMAALVLLNQQPEPALRHEYDPQLILQWAIEHWQPDKLAHTRQIIEVTTD
jgi:glutamyl-Q tRNA(Asp) synthetase